MKNDVLVVGAGPVGLTLAAELARYGLSVRIIEKAAHRTEKSKALVLWSRTLELMDRMGCTAPFIAGGFKVTAANIHADGRRLAHVDLSGISSPYPYALMIPQNDTERLLEQNLNSVGVKLERNVELVSFMESETGVEAKLRYRDGTEETADSSWLVGCDGAHSTVRHQLGMEFQGDTLNSDWILADVHLQGVPSPGEINVLWHAEGVLAIFPITTERFRVIADVGVSVTSALRPDPTLEEIQTVLDRRGPGGIRASNPIWLASFRINERKVETYRKGRAFIAGDAAHIHSPAGGQGMNTGMQDAFNLAWKVASVCHGTCRESPLLDSYSTERSAVGDQVLMGAGRLTMVATLRGGVRQAIRNHIASLVFGLSPVRKKMADAMSEVSIEYPDSPLSDEGARHSSEPHAGARAPIRDDELPVGSGGTPRFAVFAHNDENAAKFLERYSKIVESEIRKPYHASGLWLVRPDGYVAVAAQRGDWQRLSAFVDRLTSS